MKAKLVTTSATRMVIYEIETWRNYLRLEALPPQLLCRQAEELMRKLQQAGNNTWAMTPILYEVLEHCARKGDVHAQYLLGANTVGEVTCDKG